MNVILMAQGKATRFPGKHFAKIKDQPIIRRTVRLIRELAPHSNVIAVAPATPDFQAMGIQLCTQEDPGGLVDGIWNTCDLWNTGDARILLGDVVFSREVLQRVLREKRGATVYGRTGPNHVSGCGWGEIFALVVGDQWELILELLADPEARKLREGRLWGLWDRLQQHGGFWAESGDWTDDIDTPTELEALRWHCERYVEF